VNGKKFFTWLGVSVVLFGCLVGSCLLAAFSLSEAGRDFSGELWRKAGRVGGEEERVDVNTNYVLSFEEDGTVHFYGGMLAGVSLILPAGYAVRAPAGRAEDAPPFQYFIENADGSAQVRLRREDEVAGEESFYFAGDRDALSAHAARYAERIAGNAAAEATPLAFVAPSALSVSSADVGIEGCYRYTAEERERQGFDGEYFVFLGRGYNNVVLASVAFKPFARERALKEGRALLASLAFS